MPQQSDQHAPTMQEIFHPANNRSSPLEHSSEKKQKGSRGAVPSYDSPVLTGVEYLLEHLEDWKLFYNDVTEDTIRDSIGQVAEPTQERPSRTRQRPARFDDCEVDLPSQRLQGRVVPEHTSDTYMRPGKPAGVSTAAEIGGDHR
ncbi:hypothetical protein CRV24_006394 [Beauveria bassiana]|nr:hypothetical protein CRV24_006394 [Beauveria bassiana]